MVRIEYSNFEARGTGEVYATVKAFDDQNNELFSDQEVISQEIIEQFPTANELKVHLEGTRMEHWQQRIDAVVKAQTFVGQISAPIIIEGV